MSTNEIICRECEGDLDQVDLCGEHEAQLNQEVNQYPTVEKLIESIDDDLIVELMDENDAWYLVKGNDEREKARFKSITEGMGKYARACEDTRNSLDDLKDDFLESGHVDDDFRRFFFNELFYNEDLCLEYLE